MSSKPRNRQKGQESLTKKDFFDITLNPSQQKFYEAMRDNIITFGYGPAGTSKTFSACYFALQQLAMQKIDKIIICKPIKEADGDELGFLPGDVNEKTSVYAESFWHNIGKIIPGYNISLLKQEGKIEFKPLAYMRGITFDNSIIICDEAQNAKMSLLMLVITRLGKNSKIILTGDVSQHDIASRLVALPTLTEIFGSIGNVGVHVFNTADVVRHPLLVEITDAYEKWKYSDEGRKSGLIK